MRIDPGLRVFTAAAPLVAAETVLLLSRELR
jgi:hypothetical protein